MTNLYKDVKDNIKETEVLFEMANIQPSRTGLSSEIFVTFNGKEEYSQHGPRVKVKTNIGRLPIVIDGDSVYLDSTIDKRHLKYEDRRKVNEAIVYIKDNKDVFIKHWNGLIDDGQLINTLTRRTKKKQREKVGA